MKHTLSAVALALTAVTTPLMADPVRIATGEYAPMTGAALPNDGVVNGLVARLAADADVEITFEYMPWNRGLELTRNGQMHGASYWNDLADQSGLIEVGPVSTGRIVFFYRKDDPLPEWQTLNDLAGTTFGATLGYPYTEEFWALGEAGTYVVQTASNDLSNFKKLQKGRIDAFIINELVGWDLLNQSFTSDEVAQFAATELPVAEALGYLQISSEMDGGADLAARLQAAYDALEASGELEAVKTELNAASGIPSN
ncbi:transporter substrate-binding domain-containing protein [Tritonibacter scottomollicae]|uniref:Transporter substrate-binding domain-containing protein n=1 Tax=Tritonibacter scottomollicae TaxID=483013 RepID=A0ABZ0HJR2_TRISK|nr:transporter substrate-binding domain-containing protein [Tritonibacter scottomollicae]WOI34410.1 transporter substrate-binding domain-containing protein [Tritonibacter scottomollicae]